MRLNDSNTVLAVHQNYPMAVIIETKIDIIASIVNTVVTAVRN